MPTQREIEEAEDAEVAKSRAATAARDEKKPRPIAYRDQPKLEADTVLVFIPSLAALLQRAQDVKGAPLLDYEIVRVRDDGMCTVTKREYAEIARSVRGYDDIDATDVVASWHAFKPA